MKHLILMRHARAGEAENDHARPLRLQGRRDSRAMGSVLAGLGTAFQPSVVLCSTALRARDTWEDMRPALAAAPRADFEDGLYLASAGDMLRRLQRLPDGVDAALLIAHEPGLTQLVSLLAGAAALDPAARMQVGMSPGAIAAMRIDAQRWSGLEPGCAEIAAFEHPPSD